MKLVTPLAKARGLGTARSGVSHWWQQRATAIALAPLGLWFLVSVIRLDTSGHAAVVEWLRQPLTLALLILFIIALLQHAHLGLQVIIEDYVESDFGKIAGIVLVRFLAAFAGMTAIVAALLVALGSG
jgi:succinate dehydrogenase / fumarate reductase membrane anchor subunit